MLCNNCGAVVAGAANFCSRCGNRILPTSASVPAMEASPQNLMDLLPGRLVSGLPDLSGDRFRFGNWDIRSVYHIPTIHLRLECEKSNRSYLQ